MLSTKSLPVTDLPEVQFCRLPTGQKLAWREWGAGKPLIMLHGWSMSSVVFSEVAPTLAAHFRVLCPDLPGHGNSDPLVESRLQGFAEAITQWAEQLELPKAVLLGWSLGGQVALKIAAERHLQLQKLLLISTTPRFCQSENWQHGLPETQVKALERNLGRAYEKTMGDFFNLQFADGEVTQERYRQILAFAVRPGRLPEPELARDSLRVLGAVDLRGVLADIVLPTLVMHGERDQIIPPGAGEFLAARLPETQFCSLPSVGHAPFFSRQKETVRQWLKFLK
jgi:pimeloyl-[acyl-carrier protein] methyl ester esterase